MILREIFPLLMQDAMVIQNIATGDELPCHLQERVKITANFIHLTLPEAAVTLHRTYEAAYKDACARGHMLQLRRERQSRQSSLSAECITMIRYAVAMKAQVGAVRLTSRLQRNWRNSISYRCMNS